MFFLKKEEEKEGIFLGKAGRKVRIDDSKNNVLVFGKSGKSFSITLPTLLDTWNESAVVLDYEDRNYFLTSGSRKEKKDDSLAGKERKTTDKRKERVYYEDEEDFEDELDWGD